MSHVFCLDSCCLMSICPSFILRYHHCLPFIILIIYLELSISQDWVFLLTTWRFRKESCGNECWNIPLDYEKGPRPLRSVLNQYFKDPSGPTNPGKQPFQTEPTRANCVAKRDLLGSDISYMQDSIPPNPLLHMVFPSTNTATVCFLKLMHVHWGIIWHGAFTSLVPVKKTWQRYGAISAERYQGFTASTVSNHGPWTGVGVVRARSA